ncbi:hypothetical protein MN0502_19470 [Arthrobacter sp. MN05-02]|jgi:hypothetical protein|nr:hypothetical protein MN0502_19470 [Arthrobacter sp. MN05-02]
MSHKLRITVRLDIDLRWARMDVRGCLTEENCRALLPIVRRSFRILQEPNVVIDASSAQHIEIAGIDALERLGISGLETHPVVGDSPGTCSLIVPDVLPSCPARFPRPHGSHRFAA